MEDSRTRTRQTSHSRPPTASDSDQVSLEVFSLAVRNDEYFSIELSELDEVGWGGRLRSGSGQQA